MTVPPHPADAPARAVATIAAARRVLVTGLVGSDADTAVAACDLAEAIERPERGEGDDSEGGRERKRKSKDKDKDKDREKEKEKKRK